MTITWEEPPAGRRSDWQTIAQQLRDNPDRWAKVASDVSSSTGVHLRRGKYAGFTPGEFEVRTASNKGGKGDIYARFVGHHGGHEGDGPANLPDE